jgi:hypothetical protein
MTSFSMQVTVSKDDTVILDGAGDKIMSVIFAKVLQCPFSRLLQLWDDCFEAIILSIREQISCLDKI